MDKQTENGEIQLQDLTERLLHYKVDGRKQRPHKVYADLIHDCILILEKNLNIISILEIMIDFQN